MSQLETSLNYRLFSSIIIGISLLIYAVYCMLKGGTHVRGKGWVSKYSHPISYRINQVLWFFLGLSMIFSNFIFALK
ncbi:MAG: hypothetical protein CMB31_05385 [Euryarchaeota archaeon]|nr:hypothetical protein [Euryarchaeota archaeon]